MMSIENWMMTAGAGTTPVKNDVSPATTPGQAGCLQTSSPAHASAFDASSLFSAHDEADAATVMPLRLDSQQAETPRLPQSPAATTAMSVSPIQAGLVGLNVAAAQSATTGLDMASFMPPHLTPRQVKFLVGCIDAFCVLCYLHIVTLQREEASCVTHILYEGVILTLHSCLLMASVSNQTSRSACKLIVLLKTRLTVITALC